MIERDTYIFANIMPYCRLPYTFEPGELIRRSAYLYGYTYNQTHRTYNLWLSMGLKKNINILFPLFFNILDLKRSSRIYKTNWKDQRYSLYNSYLSKFINTNNKEINRFSDQSISIAENLFHNNVYLFANDVDYYVSAYDAIFTLDLNFKQHILYFNDDFMSASFFTDALDPTIFLYPELFFESRFFWDQLGKSGNYDFLFKSYHKDYKLLLNVYNYNSYTIFLQFFKRFKKFQLNSQLVSVLNLNLMLGCDYNFLHRLNYKNLILNFYNLKGNMKFRALIKDKKKNYKYNENFYVPASMSLNIYNIWKDRSLLFVNYWGNRIFRESNKQGTTLLLSKTDNYEAIAQFYYNPFLLKNLKVFYKQIIKILLFSVKSLFVNFIKLDPKSYDNIFFNTFYYLFRSWKLIKRSNLGSKTQLKIFSSSSGSSIAFFKAKIFLSLARIIGMQSAKIMNLLSGHPINDEFVIESIGNPSEVNSKFLIQYQLYNDGGYLNWASTLKYYDFAFIDSEIRVPMVRKKQRHDKKGVFFNLFYKQNGRQDVISVVNQRYKKNPVRIKYKHMKKEDKQQINYKKRVDNINKKLQD